MKKLIKLILLLSSLVCNGQVSLTRGEVYDFDIGDVIQGRYDKPWAGTLVYETKTILNKTNSINNDTLFYTVKKDVYTIITTTFTSVNFSSTTKIDTITNLTAIAQHGNITGPCIGTKDSTYLGFCNKTVWERHEDIGVSCMNQPTMERTYLIKGLGGPYYRFLGLAPNTIIPYYEYKLIYYSKVSGTCGAYVSLLNSKLVTKNNINIYPNPTKDKITIDLQNLKVSGNLKIEISDINGKLLYSENKNYNNDLKIDLTHFEPGAYFITIMSDNLNHHQKILKQ